MSSDVPYLSGSIFPVFPDEHGFPVAAKSNPLYLEGNGMKSIRILHRSGAAISGDTPAWVLEPRLLTPEEFMSSEFGPSSTFEVKYSGHPDDGAILEYNEMSQLLSTLE